MPKKYIKKINMPVSDTATDLYIKDEEAVSSINGYVVDTATGKIVYDTSAETKVEVEFANKAITDAEINTAVGIPNN